MTSMLPITSMRGMAAVLLALAAAGPGARAEAPAARPACYFWVWWHNLEGEWRLFLDFAAECRMEGVVIWGLDGWHDPEQCREVVAHAHARGVKVLHGFGLNGYHEGEAIVKALPECAAVLPEALRKTQKGEWSAKAVFCPSQPAAIDQLRKMLLDAAATGIDGFNFETADVDYVTCHCPKCEERFESAGETEHSNKPMRWPLEHVRLAADLLSKEAPHLWLTVEYAMQRSGEPPYTANERILGLNREIDPRVTVVWSEATAPPPEIAAALRRERGNVGFYVRSGAILGREAKRILSAADAQPIFRRLTGLQPRCLFYRTTLPRGRWALNMGLAATLMRDPSLSAADIDALRARLERDTAPGGRYSYIERVAPGNLAAPTTDAEVRVSSGDPTGLTDGVAEASRGMWRTERNDPKSAWAEVTWPEPRTVSEVRLFHQADGHYRSLDYTVKVRRGQAWVEVAGMPVRDNKAHGWVSHRFGPVDTLGVRVEITRSKYGNRMGLGETEIYGPDGNP